MAGIAYGLMSGWFTSATQGIELVDNYCAPGTGGSNATIVIKNLGTQVKALVFEFRCHLISALSLLCENVIL